MKYYTERPRKCCIKRHKKTKSNKFFYIVIMTFIIFAIFLYLFDKRIFPSVLSESEVTMKAEAVNIVNDESIKIFSENFDYEDIVNIEKNEEGEITMIRANTVKQHELASKVVLSCNEKLKEFGEVGVKIPLGYLTNNSFFYKMGPDITVKMKQVGAISTHYESVFESAGINQTRHKIYLIVEAKMRLIVPLKSRDLDVVCEVPVIDTIIVGKVPSTAINLDGNR